MHHSTPSTPLKNTKSGTVYLLYPPNSHVIKLSVQNQQRTNKRKIAVQQQKKDKLLSETW